MKNLRIVSVYRTIFFISFIVFILAGFFAAREGVKIVYSSSNYYSDKNAIENLQYSFDGENFSDYSDFASLDKYSKKNNMILKGTINIDNLKNPVLYIKTEDNYYDIFINNKEFLIKPRQNVLDSFKALDFKKVSLDDNGKEVVIFLYCNEPNNIAKSLDIYTANKFFVVTDLLFSGIGSLTFAVFAIVSGLLLLLSSISDRYRHYGLGIIGYLCVLLGVIWLFSFNDIALLYVDNLYFSKFIACFALYQVPIAILMFTQKYVTTQADKNKFRPAVNVYLIFIICALILEIMDILEISTFTVFVNILIVFVNILSLSVFVKEVIINKKHGISQVTTYQAMNGANRKNISEYDDTIFTKYIPIVFVIFLSLNFVGSMTYLATGEENFYIYMVAISTITLLLFCIFLFSTDIKKINSVATTDQEQRVLNRRRISLLVEEQTKLFNEASIEDICDKFSNNIKGILFPLGDIQKNHNKISSSKVKNQYIKDYNAFITESSSIVYVILKDESAPNGVRHLITAATGSYAKYLHKDPQVEMDREEFGKILFMMKGIKEPDYGDMSVIIGSESDAKGIILFKNIGNMETELRGLLESYVRTCAILIENLKLISEARTIQHETVYNLNEISELRSKETGFHIKRVSLYCGLLGSKLGMNAEEIEILQLASSMHDIGKISIPDKILNRPGKLTDEEFDIMKTHAQIGYDILKNTNNNVMKIGAIVAKYHHEKYNGKGYFGLKGEEIPKVARIVAVADVFDALSVARVYKDAWPIDRIVDLFKKERGEHFDAELVDILFENFTEFLEIRNRYKEEDE